MYSQSGSYTLILDARLPGVPGALGKPDMGAVVRLESQLPPAPDGTKYEYLNPFRCPHCSEPYIDFERHAGLREVEYYGNYHFATEPIHYSPAMTHPSENKAQLWWQSFFRK